MFATGKYQTIIDTLREAKVAMKLSGDEKYDENMQERVFFEHLITTAGAGKLFNFICRGEGSIYDAQLAAAKKWASIAAPKGAVIHDKRISDGKISFYDRDGANKSNPLTTIKLTKILKEIDHHHENNN